MEWGILIASVSVFGTLVLALSDIVNTPGPTERTAKRPIHKLVGRHLVTKMRKAA